MSNTPLAFIPCCTDGQIANRDAFSFFDGASQCDYDTRFYKSILDVPALGANDVLTGSVKQCRIALRKALGSFDAMPAPLDYPESLRSFLRRDVAQMTLGAAKEQQPYPFFLKPVASKCFEARVVKSEADFKGVPDEDSLPVWVGDVAEFVSEWRVFVHCGRVIGVCHYAGNWRYGLLGDEVANAIECFEDSGAPIAYALDFGVIQRGKTMPRVLIEANDFYALGAYGLDAKLYFEAAADRWREIISAKKEILCGV